MNKFLSELSIERPELKCFLCDSQISEDDQTISLFLKKDDSFGYPLAVILSSILSRELDENNINSKVVCLSCNERLLEYEQLEQRFIDAKYEIIQIYNQTAKRNCEPLVALDGEEELEESEEYGADLDDSQIVEIEHQNTADLEANDAANVEIMNILASDKIEENFNFDGMKNCKNIKLENYNSVIDDVCYQNNENMVEIMAEGDVQYQIIEHHSPVSNAASNVLDVNEPNEDVTINSKDLMIKLEDENSLLNGFLTENKKKRNIKTEKEEDQKPLFTYHDDKFKCILCPQAEDTQNLEYDIRTISMHLKTTHNIRVYICDICGDDFRKRTELIEHMDEDHGGADDGEFHCETCNRIFTNLRLFRIHKRLHYTSSKSFACIHCNKKYSSKNLLDEHMNMHTGERPYKCNHCTKDFASKYTLTAHLKTHSERARPHQCKTCTKAFFNAQNLQQHEKTHSGVKEYICQVCHKAFGTQHNLEVHKIVHTGYKPFICRTCGKAFARRAEIKDHERTHTGEKPFVCDICNMSFAQRSNLTTHKRATHFNDKRYKCEECDRSFKRRRLLDYHIRASHTGERPHKCSICNATFVYPEHYKKHLRIHTGVKPYACEVCGKTFNSRDNRNAHRFIHSDKKPYECLVCGQGFMRKPLLYTHMQQSGHINDTIVVNQPRISNENEKLEDLCTEDHIMEDDEMVEEHLIIDGPVQFGPESNSQDHGENSNTSEIFEEELREVISSDQILVTESGEFVKSEEGPMQIVKVRTRTRDGKESFAWVNFVTKKES